MIIFSSVEASLLSSCSFHFAPSARLVFFFLPFSSSSSSYTAKLCCVLHTLDGVFLDFFFENQFLRCFIYFFVVSNKHKLSGMEKF